MKERLAVLFAALFNKELTPTNGVVFVIRAVLGVLAFLAVLGLSVFGLHGTAALDVILNLLPSYQ